MSLPKVWELDVYLFILQQKVSLSTVLSSFLASIIANF